MRLFLDTNALLDMQEKAFEGKPFYLSYVTLRELENIKTSRNKDEEIKWKARNATRLLDRYPEQFIVVKPKEKIGDIWLPFLKRTNPDEQIIKAAKYIDSKLKGNLTFVSGDICCRNIAKKIYGLKVRGIADTVQDEYKGYKEVIMTDEEADFLYDNPKINVYNLLTNEYLIMKERNGDAVGTIDVMKWNGKEHVHLSPKPFRSKMLDSFKAFDEMQLCAMDSLRSNDITVLYGRAGSGKTTAPLSYCLQEIEKGHIQKLYFIYSYETLKGAKTLGYEKGDHQTKLLYSASIGNILASKFGSMSQVEMLLEDGTLDIIPTANIRGVEFGEDSYVFCTESQNLDVYTIKTIIQRCKKGCKLAIEGDVVGQKDVNVRQPGMSRLIDVFKGDKSFGCVKLKNNYRNSIGGLADKL